MNALATETAVYDSAAEAYDSHSRGHKAIVLSIKSLRPVS